MSNLFVNPNAEVKIDIFVDSSGSKPQAWFKSEDIPEGTETVAYEIFFREPNYKDTSELADLALALEQDGSFSMSINAVRLERVCRLLKRWTLTNSEDEYVRATRENVEKLHPEIAYAIASGFEDALGFAEAIEEAQQEAESEA